MLLHVYLMLILILATWNAALSKHYTRFQCVPKAVACYPMWIIKFRVKNDIKHVWPNHGLCNIVIPDSHTGNNESKWAGDEKPWKLSLSSVGNKYKVGRGKVPANFPSPSRAGQQLVRLVQKQRSLFSPLTAAHVLRIRKVYLGRRNVHRKAPLISWWMILKVYGVVTCDSRRRWRAWNNRFRRRNLLRGCRRTVFLILPCILRAGLGWSCTDSVLLLLLDFSRWCCNNREESTLAVASFQNYADHSIRSE